MTGLSPSVSKPWMEEILRDYNAEMSKLTGLYAKTLTSTVREERRRS